jgi:ribosomal protein S18 acetylase RimI-like enzyme
MTPQGWPDFVIDEKPDPALRDGVLKPLRAYNISQIGPINAEPLAILLRAPGNDEIVGGLWGQSAADWLFVDLLSVPEALRKQGIGTALMKKAEAIAIKRGCVGVWLHTATFQAPGFYEKLGYGRFGQLPDYPRGQQTFYYAKRLDQ